MILVGKNVKRLNTLIITVTFHKLIRILTFSILTFLLDNIFVGFNETYELTCTSQACVGD